MCTAVTSCTTDNSADTISDTTAESPVTEPEVPNYTATSSDVFLYDETAAVSDEWVTNASSIGTHIEVGDVPARSWITTVIPSNTVTKGEWLILFSNTDRDSVGLHCASAPKDTENNTGVSVIEGYQADKADDSVPCLYAAYTQYELNESGTAPVAQELTSLTPDKAHVIIISGQSNASGQTLTSYLDSSVSPEALARYQAGYPNILIDSSADGVAETNGFIPVRLGLGATEENFGPEVGLADYLSRTYPDEKFYIIEAGWSAAGLSKHFNNSSNVYQHIRKYISDSFERLVQSGLDPEVFAFCWMQGETDSFTMEDSICYGEKQDDLIKRISAVCADHLAPGGFAFLDAQISNFEGWTYAGIVNRQKQFCDALSPNRYYIDTNTPDIDTRDENNDPAHYDSDDMIQLGELFGQAVKTVIDNANRNSD